MEKEYIKHEVGYCAFTPEGKMLRVYDDGRHLQEELTDNFELAEITQPISMVYTYIDLYNEHHRCKQYFLVKKVDRITTTKIVLQDA